MDLPHSILFQSSDPAVIEEARQRSRQMYSIHPQRGQYCGYCFSLEHYSSNCPVVVNYFQRFQILHLRGACHLCMNVHTGRCRNVGVCHFCEYNHPFTICSHHSSICPYHPFLHRPFKSWSQLAFIITRNYHTNIRTNPLFEKITIIQHEDFFYLNVLDLANVLP